MSDEESTEAVPAVRTRSGRAVKKPVQTRAKPCPASRKNRKKSAVQEVTTTEDKTDEEVPSSKQVEPTEEMSPKKGLKKTEEEQVQLDEDKLLADSDSEICEATNSQEDEMLLGSQDLSEKKSDELIMNDIAMLEGIIHTNQKIEQEIGSNVEEMETNDVSEEMAVNDVPEEMAINDVSEEKEIEDVVKGQETVSEVSVPLIQEEIENDGVAIAQVVEQEKQENGLHQEENGLAQDMETDDVKAGTDDVKENTVDEIKENTVDEVKENIVDEVKENTVDEVKEKPVDDVKETTVDDVKENANDTKEKEKMGVTGTEYISDEELPAPPVEKVPEAEEVSDEELPGPERAELPADTEVVSEDELKSPKTPKKDEEADEPMDDEQIKQRERSKRKLGLDGSAGTQSYSPCYSPGSPTGESETPAKKPKEEKTEKDKGDAGKTKPKKLPELDKYWKAVNDDPADFTGWTYLLQYVDQENDMEAAREAYDAFLSHYPYCYGYWRKYADYEKKKGYKKKCEEVFERGLKAIPLSVDLWIHYLSHVKTVKGEDEEYLRMQFERALGACGLEFRSDRLWDTYIKWETEGKRLQKVTSLFDRLLAIPTQGYTSHFDSFQDHVASNLPNKILDVDEFMALRKEVRATLKSEEKAEDVELPPGDEDSKVYTTEDETKAIRERIVSIRRKVHKNTVNAVQARWNFEEGIKRPYFHVKPLERCQLKNWQEYLDYEIAQGDKQRITVLFERCLIACALYEDFWMKYINFLESNNTNKDPEQEQRIREIYERACTIHHLKKPNLHCQWAMFEECCGNPNRAVAILENLEKQVPNLLPVAYRRINLERRRNELQQCCELFEHYMVTFKNKMISSNIAIKYARFCLIMLTDFEKAKGVLKSAIEKDPNNSRLYLQLIDLHMQNKKFNPKDVLEVLDEFLDKEGVDPDQKAIFAHRKLLFLEDYTDDLASVKAATEQYHNLLQKSSKKTIKKKENAVDSATPSSSRKKAKESSSTSQSQASYGNGSYGNSAGHQPPYNYSGTQQQGQYNYPQYGQGDQYQYQNWQYPPQGGYGGYNQWSGYTGGYGY
ncbi:unnamed protein product [Ceutorhynchus assimilis]|uniref:Pre-mRNA-processing factor 39 n=1 Tax=Ceutorhynchus assimilis TaxID=467358 RepID=A0A9N9MYG1_9CUCU|nr:unnamed protein product [Ceutorhynchus assimilis]